jgi:hypothetical protein
MGCILDVMIKDNSAGALGYQQIAQIRFHKTDSRLGPANPLERLIKLSAAAELMRVSIFISFTIFS